MTDLTTTDPDGLDKYDPAEEYVSSFPIEMSKRDTLEVTLPSDTQTLLAIFDKWITNRDRAELDQMLLLAFSTWRGFAWMRVHEGEQTERCRIVDILATARRLFDFADSHEDEMHLALLVNAGDSMKRVIDGEENIR